MVIKYFDLNPLPQSTWSKVKIQNSTYLQAMHTKQGCKVSIFQHWHCKWAKVREKNIWASQASVKKTVWRHLQCSWCKSPRWINIALLYAAPWKTSKCVNAKRGSKSNVKKGKLREEKKNKRWRPVKKSWPAWALLKIHGTGHRVHGALHIIRALQLNLNIISIFWRSFRNWFSLEKF